MVEPDSVKYKLNLYQQRHQLQIFKSIIFIQETLGKKAIVLLDLNINFLNPNTDPKLECFIKSYGLK